MITIPKIAITGTDIPQHAEAKIPVSKIQKEVLRHIRKFNSTLSAGKPRVLPSTLTLLPDGNFQLMANTVVTVGETSAKRPELVDSIVTFGSAANGNPMVLEVKTPSMEYDRT